MSSKWIVGDGWAVDADTIVCIKKDNGSITMHTDTDSAYLYTDKYMTEYYEITEIMYSSILHYISDCKLPDDLREYLGLNTRRTKRLELAYSAFINLENLSKTIHANIKIKNNEAEEDTNAG